MALVRSAQAEDVPDLVRTLVKAFVADPVASYIFPSDLARPTRLERFFDLQIRHTYLPRGEVWTNDQKNSVLLAMPPWPAALHIGDRLAQLSLFSIVADRFFITRRLSRQLALAHPRTPHFYLGTLGTLPDQQRTGQGSALVRTALRRCDERGWLAYLECSREENVAFYDRFGFVVRRTLDIERGGPRLWLMTREAQPSVAGLPS